MRSKTFIVLAAFVSIAISTYAAEPPPKLLPGEALTLGTRTPARITGTFVHDKVTVGFDSVREGTNVHLTLRDVEGRPIYDAQSDGKTYRLDFYNGKLFATGAVPVQTTRKQRRATAVPQPKLDGDRAAIQQFAESPEYRVLPFLSRALAGEGILGTTHPASLYLHGLALSSAQQNRINVPEVTVVVVARPPCPDQRKDPCKNSCFGMCGPGCTCWKWVCGDCCMHVGCLTHDVTCRLCDCGFFSHRGDCVLCYTAISFLGAHPCTVINGCQTPPNC